MFLRTLLLAATFSCLVFGQSWEVGVGGGYGLYHDLSVTAGATTGSAGFEPGAAFTAVLGNNIGGLVGGEARYTYRAGDMRVSSGSTKVTLGAQTHAIHYDILVHATSKESKIRPFLAAGAGMKYYRGNGSELIYQPLNNLVVLTHTNEAQPLLSLGGGVKFSLTRRSLFRIDFRDYATPAPTSLLAVPAGSKVSGWLHDFVVLVGVSGVF